MEELADNEGNAMNDFLSGDIDKQTRTWSMLLHLSLLANAIAPLAGVIAPIIIWQVKKDELPGIDAHGKMAMNFIITMFIYTVIAGILVFVVIGVFLLMALALIGIVLPIIAAIKANEGEVWEYPLVFKFLT